MPRFARVVIPQCPHHLTQRGNERRDIFFTAADRRVYLGLLKHYLQVYPADLLGYCLMTNHVHLVVVPRQPESLAKLMRHVQMRYSQYRHAMERGSGHLWQGRYYSCPIEPDRLGAVMCYVELNPVRAGLAAEAQEYAWSSAGVHLGARDRLGLVAMNDWRQCWTAQQWRHILDSGLEQSEAIREATYGGRPLGSADFVATLERCLGRRLARGRPGRPSHQEAAAARI